MTELLLTQFGDITQLSLTEPPDDSDDFSELHDSIANCIHQQDIHIVLDFSNIKAISSAFLESLLDINDQLNAHGGWLKTTNCNSIANQIFDISGFNRYISPLDTNGDSLPENNDKAGKRLGDILVSRHLIDEKTIKMLMDKQHESGLRLGQLLIEQKILPEYDVLSALSQQLNTPFIDIRPGLFDPRLTGIIPPETLHRLNIFPLFLLRNTLSVALTDAQDIAAIDELEERTQCQIRPVLATTENIRQCIADFSGTTDISTDFITDIEHDLELVESNIPSDYTEIDELSAGSPIINLVNSIIQRAIKDGASDIHIEPGPSISRIRFRVDSILYEVMTPRIDYHPAIVSRLKVMANLDISERRMPQDGRIQVITQKQNVDLRFSSLPGLHGEKVVLRVLDKKKSILDLNKLGFSAENLQQFHTILKHSYGLILVTGPTGSGKTTSLYAALSHLNSLEQNIVTVEDPVEYQLDIINQNEVREAIGLSFSRMLKHILRQDPDIVMVGEIRERETAQIAVQAALTGHLVLSTLHTNDSVSAVTRMIDMGVEPYLLSSALVAVVAQRLVRRVCPNCKTFFRPPPELIERFNWHHHDSIRLATGRGCSECYDSGYKGRLGIHEILTVDSELQSLIMKNPSRDDLNQYAQKRQMKSLFHDGLDHVLSGETSLEEVSRVIGT